VKSFLKEFLIRILDKRNLEGSRKIFEYLVSNSLEGIFLYIMGERMDRELKENLQKRLSFLIMRDTVQRNFLREISLKMKRKGLRFLILKGPAIADELYPPLTRFYEDIDILVHEEDYNSARDLILRSGFMPFVGRDGFVFTPAFKEEIFIHEEMDYLQIDLHRALFSKYRFNMDFEEVWSSSREFEISGIMLRKMNPLKEFIYLLLHSAAHFYKLRGINILDISLHHRKFRHDIGEVLDEMRRKKNHYAGYYMLKFLIKNGFIIADEREIERIKPSPFSRILMSLLTSFDRIEYLRFERLPFLVRAGTVLASTPGVFNKSMFIYHYLRRRGDAIVERFRARGNKDQI
jgi:hypothetical protein